MRTDRIYTQEADKDHFVTYPSILSDEEYDELTSRPRYARWGTICPTCKDTGTYRWQGTEHDCLVDFDNKCFQWKYWRMYELSNIDDRYMRLNWEDIAEHQSEGKALVDEYVSMLPGAVERGYGLYIYSTGLGTGKTFSATHILKEAAKLDTTKVRHRGYFVSFQDLIQATLDHDDWLTKKIMHTNILVLDDVTMPSTVNQTEMFPRTLEKVVRYRSNNDMPTIVTSNMTWELFAETYPRCHSVLSDSVMPVKLDDTMDYRVVTGFGRAWNASKQGEVPPIT